MDVAGVLSILWVVGSVFACVMGCHRARVLGRKIRTLEEKLEKTKSAPVVYSVPVYTPPGPAPTAPYYENPRPTV